jgi:hypothetical protein
MVDLLSPSDRLASLAVISASIEGFPMIAIVEEGQTLTYALAGLASLVALLLAWLAYRQAARESRERKDETKRR